jgi:TPP-dependent pyruvate/acetoin dehydrogenase alpha subunit
LKVHLSLNTTDISLKFFSVNHKIIIKALLIRNVEQAFLNLFSGRKLNGTVHTCIGQELCTIAFLLISNRLFP